MALTTPRRRDGFTIINVLVAIVLLVAGVLALGTSNAETMRGQSLAQNRTNALAIARAHLEDIRTRDPWSLSSDSAATVGDDGQPAGNGKFTRRVTITEERANLLLIEVEVDFPRSPTPVRLTTYLYRGSSLAAGS